MMKRNLLAATLLLCATAAYARDPYRISVWVRNNGDSVYQYNLKNNGTMTEVNPVSYSLLMDPYGNVSIDTSHVVTGINTTGAEVVPVIQNIVNGGWSTAATTWILANPDTHAAQIKALLDANPGYAGIELDYESMVADDPNNTTLIAQRKAAFVTLVEKIKAQIGSKRLSVCVYRLRDAAGTNDSRNARVYDYAGLTGPYAADAIKIMMYPDTSMSPPQLVNNGALDQALNYADSAVTNHNKLIVGLPWYGYDITAQSENVDAPAAPPGASRNVSGELTYYDGSHQWVVVDEEAFRQKILRALATHDVGGFAMWDPGRIKNFNSVWEVVRGRINQTIPSGTSITVNTPPFCPPTPYTATANVTVPYGAASLQFPWYEWGFQTGNYIYRSAGNYNSSNGVDTTATGLTAGSFMARVNGVDGQRVFEAESSMFTITCRVRAAGH